MERTRDCTRCGKPSEKPVGDSIIAFKGKVVKTTICIECQEVCRTDTRKYFDEGWDSLRQQGYGK